MRGLKAFSFLVLFLLLMCTSFELHAEVSEPTTLKIQDVTIRSTYPWKKDIVTTYFWIGQGSSGYNSMTNYKSAWDGSWTKNYGGEDCPKNRLTGKYKGTVSLPETFAPTLNPFYIALPYNDIKYPKMSKKYVPWWNHDEWRKEPYKSQCKGRWVMIEHQGKVCFAQWEDVGPFRYDHAAYIFGNERPKIHSKAGLDVSPAVRDYLGLTGLDKTNWRFVEEDEIPYGPWIKYAEQAIVYSVIKKDLTNKYP